MEIISVVNYKGGVGKTTLLANIATELANRGKRILIIDLDPQGSLTFSFLEPEVWIKEYKETKTIKNWFDDRLNNKTNKISNLVIQDLEVNKYVKEPIGLISSHLGLFNVGVELAAKLNGKRKRILSKKKLETLYLLKEGLSSINGKYDFVFLDCQPNFDIITQNAIVASDYYLIPTKFDYLSTLGVNTLKEHIDNLLMELNDSIREFNFNGYNINPKLLGIIGNMTNLASGDKCIALNETYLNTLNISDNKVFKNKLRSNPSFMDMGELIPAILKKQTNNTHKSIVKEIKNITDEFNKRISTS